jgi:serine/threonine-protein kinase
VVGALDHPNIVPVHDVGREDEGYYFVMKHLEGETLEVVIQRLVAGDRRTKEAWQVERRVAVFRALLPSGG